jgi:1-acyl-sn-glycerol-3-phosphate acyltransferase
LIDGSPIAVFPEGSYSSRGLAEFKPGAFVAAKRAGVPIVPVLIEGTGAAWAPGTVVVHGKHRIRIAVQAPIDAEEVAASSVDALIERTREKLVAARELSYAGNEKPEPR